MKQKLLKVAYEESIRAKKHKYMKKWITEFDKKQRGQHAQNIMSFSLLHQVYGAWKTYTYNNRLAKSFFLSTYGLRLKFAAMQGLKRNVIINRF